jgi:hypothetical protein
MDRSRQAQLSEVLKYDKSRQFKTIQDSHYFKFSPFLSLRIYRQFKTVQDISRPLETNNDKMDLKIISIYKIVAL